MRSPFLLKIILDQWNGSNMAWPQTHSQQISRRVDKGPIRGPGHNALPARINLPTGHLILLSDSWPGGFNFSTLSVFLLEFVQEGGPGLYRG